MTCYHPLSAYELTGQRTENGKAKIVFNSSEIDGPHVDVTLPCGKCIGCRLDKSRDWALRCVHEQQTMEEDGFESCFITCTYNEENYDVSLNKDDFPAFIKRLRTHNDRMVWSHVRQTFIPRTSQKKAPIRYFQCGEYGDLKTRRHHHAAIFGFDFPDKELWEINTETGENYYRSDTLEKLWSFGWCIIGQLSWESAAYIARYTTKKVNGELAKSHYKTADIHTGEVLPILPEFVTMSRRPGIGDRWYQKYGPDLHSKDYVTVNGRKFSGSKFYDTRLDKTDPQALSVLKRKRIERAKEHAHDNTLRRLRDREVVKKAQVGKLKRS